MTITKVQKTLFVWKYLQSLANIQQLLNKIIKLVLIPCIVFLWLFLAIPSEAKAFAQTSLIPDSTLIAFQNSVDFVETVGQEQNQSPRGKWYEGGTLHHASVLEWQQASYENKLATCADFVAGLSMKKLLKPMIQNQVKSMDDIRRLAQELLTQMDTATEEFSDPAENRQVYENQKVNDIAGMLVIFMDWVKIK